MIPYAAYLRVYEPLTAFPDDERERWTAYIHSGAAPDPVTGAAAEHAAGVAELLGQSAEKQEQAFVRLVDGRHYVCPWRTQVRCWQALVGFRSSLPEDLVAAFFPAGTAAAVALDAENSLEKWVVDNPALRTHVRSSTWTVPLRWLALVEAAERQLVLGPRPAAGPGEASVVPNGQERRCSFVTTMAQARRRAARGLNVLRHAIVEGPITAGVEEDARWFEEFHPHAFVELDYGGLVHLFTDEALIADDSPALVAAALRALDAGDTTAAATAYETVMERWRPVQAHESAN